MAWTKHFQFVNTNKKLDNSTHMQLPGSNGLNSKFSSYLPEVYAGHPQRIERYSQYDLMNNDSEIAAALDTITDFCTRPEENTGNVFDILYNGNQNDSEIAIIKTVLAQWIRLNKFKQRLWRIFRNTIMYGDQFFVRDPETLKWYGVANNKVEQVYVNEAKGKEPVCYMIRDLDANLKAATITNPDKYGINIQGDSTVSLQQYNTQGNKWNATGTSRFEHNQNVLPVDAKHVIHLSLSEGLDANWPFGTSILEPIFKVFKQKELLEDAVIIYRVQRAPERRVFYVDTGNIAIHKVPAYLERVKMEMHQRRIPNRTGGGNNIMDAAYNPLSMMEDYFFAVTPEGRGSRVETLPGGENLGVIDDLRYFNNKLIRGLRVPSSYLPTGPDDGTQTFNDGRVGTAYMQEYRFARYCHRLQILLSDVFDDEFKLFLKMRGYNIDSSIFEIQFNPPQYFREYAQIERDSAYINIFQPLADVKYLSKRFILERFLGLTEEEISRNEQLWRQENPNKTKSSGPGEVNGSAPGLDSIGVRSTPNDSDFDINSDNDDPFADFNTDIDVDNNSDTGLDNDINSEPDNDNTNQ